MELALSLGHQTPKPNISFLEKKSQKIVGDDLGFCMAVGTTTGNDGAGRRKQTGFSDGQIRRRTSSSDSPPVQLDLLPFSPVNYRTQPSSNKLSFPWLNQNLGAEVVGRGMEINLKRNEEAILLQGASNNSSSSPNSSTVSSFQMNFSVFRPNSAISRKRGFEKIAENNNNINSCELLGEADRIRGSDDDNDNDNDEDEINGNNNNNMSRKKLRLTKEQSAFLEDSFKEHNTLNPKQKVALAKQLNLRPRQVEVWFQNRRARTKLKQTEVDCEYLKRWCETLTQENKKLHKELSELKALNSHPNSFFMQLPPTTLTMCPSCERVAPTTAAAAQSPVTATTAAASKHFSLSPSHIAHAQHAS
ncbi:hypothetical protein ABFX02_10G175000 [Erythranthe guttata]